MAQLFFKYGFDERDQEECLSRGYLSHVQVKTENGKLYSVFFYDKCRLLQDVEEEYKLGNFFLAEAGMIIVEKVNLQNMQNAVDRLEKEGFFNHFSDISSL